MTDPDSLSGAEEAQLKLLREQLISAESRFRALCEALPVVLLVIGADGTVQFINRKFERVFSLCADQIVGENLLTLLENRAQDGFNALLGEAVDRGGQLEVIASRGDGSTFPSELSLSDFDTGGHSLYLASFMDITERHEVERLKQELIAMVSHDLSSPLSSIQVTLNLLSTGALGALTEKGTDLVKRAELSAAQLVKLINDLLTVERLERGKVEIFPEMLEVAQLFDDARLLVEEMATARRIAISTESTLLRVWGDRERLKQVVTNLLSNAIKFSPPGGTVTLSARDLAETVEIVVADEGRGVPSKDQRRIFERFQQVAAADASEKGGKGLGLAICKALVEQHGGAIGVSSPSTLAGADAEIGAGISAGSSSDTSSDTSAGPGSRFWFTLPKKH